MSQRKTSSCRCKQLLRNSRWTKHLRRRCHRCKRPRSTVSVSQCWFSQPQSKHSRTSLNHLHQSLTRSSQCRLRLHRLLSSNGRVIRRLLRRASASAADNLVWMRPMCFASPVGRSTTELAISDMFGKSQARTPYDPKFAFSCPAVLPLHG